jgi:putative SOS response-associated peptidase YedK
MPAYQMNPDQMGPIVRNTTHGKKQLVHARWGLPSRYTLEKAAKAKAEKLEAKGKPFDLEELIRMEADRGTTNVRKLSFPHWTRWFGVESRCLVPVTSFAEPDPASQEEGAKVPNAWFARDEEKSLMFFAGIHVPQWQSVRKVRDGLATCRRRRCGRLFERIEHRPKRRSAAIPSGAPWEQEWVACATIIAETDLRPN